MSRSAEYSICSNSIRFSAQALRSRASALFCGGLVKQLKQGKVNLDDPAVTLALLRFNAVLGVKGFFGDDTGLESVGITCALCHSTVDNSLTTGIGHRLDGWANRDLNVGEVVALAPDLSPFSNLLGVSQDTVRAVLRSWGPGKFDAELILDGKAFNPQQISNGVVTGTDVSAAKEVFPTTAVSQLCLTSSIITTRVLL